MPKKQSLWERAVGDDYQSPGKRKKKSPWAGRNGSVVAQTRMEQLLEDLKRQNLPTASDSKSQLATSSVHANPMFPATGGAALLSAASRLQQCKMTQMQGHIAHASASPTQVDLLSDTSKKGSVSKAGPNLVAGSASMLVPPAYFSFHQGARMSSAGIPSLLTSNGSTSVQFPHASQPVLLCTPQQRDEQAPAHSQVAIPYRSPLPGQQQFTLTEHSTAQPMQVQPQLQQRRTHHHFQHPHARLPSQLQQWPQSHKPPIQWCPPRPSQASVLQLLANTSNRTMHQRPNGPGPSNRVAAAATWKTVPSQSPGGPKVHTVTGTAHAETAAPLNQRCSVPIQGISLNRLSSVRLLQSSRPMYLSANIPDILVPVQNTGILHDVGPMIRHTKAPEFPDASQKAVQQVQMTQEICEAKTAADDDASCHEGLDPMLANWGQMTKSQDDLAVRRAGAEKIPAVQNGCGVDADLMMPPGAEATENGKLNEQPQRAHGALHACALEPGLQRGDAITEQQGKEDCPHGVVRTPAIAVGVPSTAVSPQVLLSMQHQGIRLTAEENAVLVPESMPYGESTLSTEVDLGSASVESELENGICYPGVKDQFTYRSGCRPACGNKP